MCFGLVKLFSCFVSGWEALTGVRFLLGLFEAALFPGCVYVRLTSSRACTDRTAHHRLVPSPRPR